MCIISSAVCDIDIIHSTYHKMCWILSITYTQYLREHDRERDPIHTDFLLILRQWLDISGVLIFVSLLAPFLLSPFFSLSLVVDDEFFFFYFTTSSIGIVCSPSYFHCQLDFRLFCALCVLFLAYVNLHMIQNLRK